MSLGEISLFISFSLSRSLARSSLPPPRLSVSLSLPISLSLCLSQSLQAVKFVSWLRMTRELRRGRGRDDGWRKEEKYNKERLLHLFTCLLSCGREKKKIRPKGEEKENPISSFLSVFKLSLSRSLSLSDELPTHLFLLLISLSLFAPLTISQSFSLLPSNFLATTAVGNCLVGFVTRLNLPCTHSKRTFEDAAYISFLHLSSYMGLKTRITLKNVV